jgi:hypothetical protein
MQESLSIVPEFNNVKSTGEYNNNWLSLKNPTLTLKERIRRWVELTELASNLGYQQPRITAIVKRLEQMLQINQHTKQIIPLKIDKQAQQG